MALTRTRTRTLTLTLTLTLTKARDMALTFGAKAEGAAHLHAATSTVAPDT